MSKRETGARRMSRRTWIGDMSASCAAPPIGAAAVAQQRISSGSTRGANEANVR